VKRNLLGVLPYGDNKGFPFDILFGGTTPVDRPKDLTPDIKALVFWGGTDIWSGFYGEEPNTYNQNKRGASIRDSVEWGLMELAIEHGIPIIGVCRGAQMLCAKAGGTLIQHIDGHHTGAHKLDTFDSNPAIYANSCHHQMMNLPANGVELLAWTSGLSSKHLGEHDKPLDSPPRKEPEIVHFKKLNSIGIQGHPEWCERGSSFVDYCLDLIKDRVL
jgi:GMP synthase-like glutamine amidotransferase